MAGRDTENELITEIHLNSGPSESGEPLVVPLQPSITVFVGPNNSGKSLLLREIAGYCSEGPSASGFKVLGKLTYDPVDEETATRELAEITRPNLRDNQTRPGYVQVTGHAGSLEIRKEQYFQGRSNPNGLAAWHASTYVRNIAKHLDGNSRLSLINDQGLGDMKRPEGLLSTLLANDAVRARLRQKIYDQLGLSLALDITGTPNVGMRLGQEPPPNEKTFEAATIEYMAEAVPIANFSDGVRAFCGILTHIHVGKSRIITVDEPEAFLAPPLAHSLGKELALAAQDEGKVVFASTHSPHFLSGAIAAGAQVNIIRLTYDARNGATARLLEASELRTLMNDPMLRSANVLSALFYRAAIVGEADADRAFYQECNERLLTAQDARGSKDTIFLNANGKDVVPMIVAPLRRLGIPTASVLDLDCLNQGGEVWTRHLKAAGIPRLDHQPFGARRANLIEALEAADANYKRNGGLAVLSGEELISARALLRELSQSGMFLVDRGEVEAWLSDLSVPRSKSLWLRAIFEKMGSDPGSVGYVRPAAGDVWDFIGGITAWLQSNQ